ncbi:MAG: hypothetical protein JWP02_2228 [Acidimicrobiales bacterium]|nr:hypothetical protein [Acidimicrobiales bacterium]
MPWSSNGTYLVKVCLDGQDARAVYKPVRGERPLWDFPPGLYRREVAAYVVAEALGWGLVPETVLRDGPLGTGSLQRFMPSDFQQHYFTLLEFPEHHDALQAICTFDLVVNNADRKGGHCLLGEDGRVWSVDHGLCFHADPKLRTVMWDFEGQAVPEHLVADLARFAVSLPDELGDLLDGEELEALAARAAAIVRRPVFPAARSGRPYPWPLV